MNQIRKFFISLINFFTKIINFLKKKESRIVDINKLQNENNISKPDREIYCLIIGCNYENQSGELYGCQNDASLIVQTLANYHYNLNGDGVKTKDNLYMKYLLDRKNFEYPTKKNIIEEINKLVININKSGYGYLYYAGHGYNTYDKEGDEDDGMDEVIIPYDHDTNGIITDDWLYENFVKKLNKNTNVRAIYDCCHSGTIMDLQYTFANNNFKNNDKKIMSNIIVASGCTDSQQGADIYDSNREASHGAMTSNFCKVLKDGNINKKVFDVQNETNIKLNKGRFNQNCVITSSFDPINSYFFV